MPASNKLFKNIAIQEKFVVPWNNDTFAAIKVSSRTAEVYLGEDTQGDDVWATWYFKQNEEFFTSNQIVFA